ncbi:MAG: translocation/assembly module TamB domain-containing protein [Kiritimatiellia bacterium]
MSRIKRCVRGLLAGLVLLTLIAGGLIVLLTPWGLRRITPMLETRLSGLLSMEVAIEDPSLSWPLTLRVDSITASDGNGQIRIGIREARIRVSPRQLLKGRAHVYRLSIEHLIFSGWPAAARDGAETDSGLELPLRLPDLEMLFEKVTVRDLHIQRVRLEPPLVQDPIELTLRGSFSNRTLEADLELLTIADRTYTPSPRLSVSLDVSAYNRFQNRDLMLKMEAESFAKLIPDWPETLEDDIELSLDLSETRETYLRISKGALRTPAGDLTVTGELNLTTATLKTTMEIFLPDLTRLQAWIPVDVSGAVRLHADVRGPLDDLAVDLQVTGGNLGVFDQTLNVELDYASRISTFTREGVLTVNVEAEDMGKAEGRIRLNGGKTVVEVTQLDLQVAGMDLTSDSRLVISLEGPNLHVEPWELRLGKGRLRVAGDFTDNRIDFTAEILEFPVTGFGFAPWLDSNAEFTGQIHLTGRPDQPEAAMSLDFRGLRPENTDAWDGPPARFRVGASLSEQVVKASFRLEDLPGDPVSLDVEIPLDLSLVPFRITWPPEGEVRAHVQANTDLAGLSRLFVFDVYHNLAGMLKVDVRVSGTAKDPQVHGTIEMASGRYEHELTGTLLQDLSLGITAEREHLSLSRFQATDGGGGKVTASGRVEFKPSERYPFKAQVSLEKFHIMQNDRIEAGGEGRLEISGTLDESRLTGRILLAPLNVTVPETLPPRLYELEVVEVFDEHDPRRESEPEKAETSIPRRHRLLYDLSLNAPGRVFVRGQGLDSEWSARIHVTGEGSEPQLSGDLTLLRGRLMFFGKRLQLNRGIITFDGSFPPSPLLDVEAQLRSGGIVGYVRVSGPAENPELELDSSPPLPEDEILAQMLFGRESARISPWQALTLARAITKLRGGGSTFDLMGETRRVLRVDQIDVRTPEEKEAGTTVTVGKYVSDRVYMEYEQSVGAESGRASVEVDLTPSIRLETTTGGDSDTGIGIRWTREY